MTRLELRRSPRVRPGGIVRVTLLDKALAGTGTLLDISETGVGLLVEAPIEAGTTVHLELHDHLLVGNVVYCDPTEAGPYRVGLQLLNRLGGAAWETLLRRWTPAANVAEHRETHV
jgi:hypothetical protein